VGQVLLDVTVHLSKCQERDAFKAIPLEFPLRTFATSLREAGDQDRAMYSKVGLVADLGLWLGRTRRAVSGHLDEQLLECSRKVAQRCPYLRSDRP
jgi:hypothetical protein